MADSWDTQNQSKKESLDYATAKVKIAKYCAYQERAHYEVEQKLYSYGLYSDQVEELLAWLITENYVNEIRYATAFVGGKFRIKKWGRVKIKQQLEQKRVTQICIEKALLVIDEEEYIATMQQLILQKWQTTSANNIYELRNKVAKFAIGKGYEADKVWPLAKTIIN